MRARVIALMTSMAVVVGLIIAPAARAEDGTPSDPAVSQAPVNPSPAEPAPPVDPVVTEIEAASVTLGPRSNEAGFAHGRSAARDMRGVMPSLYRGKWYSPRYEKSRRCIVRRESDANYRAVSAGGLYRGAYQMNRRLAVSATYAMQREVRREIGPAAAAKVAKLRSIPTQTWNRYWQDRAFWTIMRKGKGASHWRGGAWGCFGPTKAQQAAAKAKAAKAKAAKVKAAKAKAAKAKAAKAKAAARR